VGLADVGVSVGRSIDGLPVGTIAGVALGRVLKAENMGAMFLFRYFILRLSTVVQSLLRIPPILPPGFNAQYTQLIPNCPGVRSLTPS